MDVVVGWAKVLQIGSYGQRGARNETMLNAIVDARLRASSDVGSRRIVGDVVLGEE